MHCVSLRSFLKKLTYFPEAHARVDSGHRIQRYAWFNSGYMHRVSLQWLGIFTEFLREGGSDPEVRIGLWRLTPLSWRRGRFPWFAFLRFSIYSTLIRWSSSVVQVLWFVRSCGRQSRSHSFSHESQSQSCSQGLGSSAAEGPPRLTQRMEQATDVQMADV